MGWLFISGSTRRSTIEERTCGWETTRDGVTIKAECIRHCYRGSFYRGILWTIWKQTFAKNGTEVQPERRFIGCDLLEFSKRNDGWGYKDMDESMHPYFYSCPLSYLELVPIERFGGNADWRKLVIDYHQRQKEKRNQKRKTA